MYDDGLASLPAPLAIKQANLLPTKLEAVEVEDGDLQDEGACQESEVSDGGAESVLAEPKKGQFLLSFLNNIASKCNKPICIITGG